MALYEHLYDVEVWHRRSKELMREAEEARLAKRLRARHPKRTREATAAAKWGLLVAALVVAALMLVGASNPAHASTTFTVTNTTDANNLCDADGCSLREAITAANNTPNSGGPDLIRFDIPQGFADPQSGVMSI